MAPATSPNPSRHGTLIGMPGKGTAKRTIRVEAPLWDRFGEFVEARGMDRATALKDFMRWCLGETDMPLAGRPVQILADDQGNGDA